MALQVAQDRAVVMAFAKGPVIDAEDADGGMLRRQRRLPHATQQRVGAGRHRQLRGQPGPASPPRAKPILQWALWSRTVVRAWTAATMGSRSAKMRPPTVGF